MARAIIFASRTGPLVIALDMTVDSLPSKYRTRLFGFNLRFTFNTTVPFSVFPATIAERCACVSLLYMMREEKQQGYVGPTYADRHFLMLL
eukprot:scaffold1469_cov119-Cylindrotheca_fusiformis.AAC.26